MSLEAVKRQILIAVDALSLPLNRVPSAKAVADACSAVKLLRNRLLREHTRVIERIEALRERQAFDEDSEGDSDYEGNEVDSPSGVSAVSRTEFVFVCEMMVAEKLVVPLLIAHGMSFTESLLPQLLKLLAVMLLPVPRYSADELGQKDLLQRIKARCGTDEFFALLVQCVAPIAEKRTSGELQRDDVVVLEIILTIITYLLDGSATDAERITGAFCRNHGIELLLVVINQNYSRIRENAAAGDAVPRKAASGEAQEKEAQIGEAVNNTAPAEEAAVKQDEFVLWDDKEEEVDLEDDDSLTLSELPETMNLALEWEFKQQVHNLLESEEQLWKWNCLVLASIARVVRCVPAEELAQLTLLDHSTVSTPDQLLNTLRNGQQLRECKKNTEKWRLVARSRNGSVTSNGILVRANAGGATGNRAIGSVSALLGSRRSNPLEAMKDMDLRKRGRLVKGMYQGAAPQCNLPLPTKIQLSQQSNSFLCFGFEPLSVMTFSRLQDIAASVEHATKEHREVVAGYKSSGEVLEVTSPIESALYQKLSSVLNYMTICRCTLRYVRVIIEQLKSEQDSFLTIFSQQWQSISSLISLDYLELGFSVLRSFLDCKDLRRREDVTNIVGFLSEILLVLNLLLQGDIAADPAVEVAAHALASSVLYKEDNIRVVFGLLSEYSSRVIAIRKAQQFTLFAFSVFQLMEKCSYKGNLLLPKRAKKRKEDVAVSGDEAADAAGVERHDDGESVDSATLEELNEEMLREMADMIDDEDSVNCRKERDAGDDAERDDEVTSGRDERAFTISPTPGEENGIVLPEPLFGPLEGSAVMDHDGVAGSERALSEGRPPSIASSGRTALSTISSEREVAVSGFFHRLATPKNVGLVYSTLRHWRVNDADVNVALTFLMDSLVRNNCETVFFNVAFLLLFREVLVHGEKTHAPLYAVCDRIVYDFFNPSFARMQDARASTALPDEVASGMLSGAQSFLGFEVALRCMRALFNLSSSDYAYLEERGMPHLMYNTEIPLPGATADLGALHELPEEHEMPAATTTAAAKSSRHKSKKGRRATAGLVDKDEEGEGEVVLSESELDESEEEESGALKSSPANDEGVQGKKRRKSKTHHHRHNAKKRSRRERGGTDAVEGAVNRESDPNLLLGESEDYEWAAAEMERAAAAAQRYGSMDETLVIE